VPIYEYSCQNCDHEFELLIRGKEKPNCPECGEMNLTKNFSAPAAHTSSTKEPSCQTKGTCDLPNCCGQQFQMNEWE